MSDSRLLSKEFAVAVVMSQFIVALPVYAGGFQLNETSPSLQGSAMAGSAAAANDVSALFNNPATLSALQQNQIYVAASEFIPEISMYDGMATHTFFVPGMPPSAIVGSVQGDPAEHNISNAVFIPQGYMGWRTPIDKLTVGLAVVEPFYLYNKYSEDSVLRYASVKTEINSVDINPSLSYQIHEKLSLGAGFQAQYLKTIFSHFNGINTGIPPIDELIAATEPTYLKSDGWGYGYTVGALYQMDSMTRIGVSYRSEISTKLSGHGEQYTIIGDIVPSPANTFLFNSETSVSHTLRTPGVLTIGVARDIQQWTLKATAQVNFWDYLDDILVSIPDAYEPVYRVPMKWHNSFFGALGADYRYNSSLTLRGGFAWDQSPLDSENRNSLLPDSDKYWLNLGLSYLVNNHFSVDAAYSHIFIHKQSINTAQVNAGIPGVDAPLEINQASADYKGTENIVSLGLRYSC
ncbi:outer membrane protein transport protein [Fluoribacter dumoffii]|uniref:Outer membrane protein NMB0088 n=1 Tax=Fluoribacter dumoffii TaxID=463 RepID=A0A377GD75_9GAMM|nr:outer membrane protein transport protein [Fluoribacter dumoffii]KTC90558.1 long-chain fatty acid transporter [Fluoribacter dumoffii NY 23]MCW8386238.1 outer membrane protein transport protein [Fluoribacter dumoffii]MCW8498489.1 outer membrane protein transport protein [Fluoribacter dumoffii]STO22238.1 Putative outer membrane protein NMB0088 precursor [Fluoribacter dumoffii]